MKKDEIIIDFYQYTKSQLSIAHFTFLMFIYLKEYSRAIVLLTKESIDLGWLEDNLYIKIATDQVDEIFPRQKTLDLFQSPDEKSVDTWIQEWCDLFPKGVKSGGYYIRSNKEDCLKKMIKFIKTRKYSKSIIMKATSNYIERKARENYAYMMKAEYFIEKDGMSALATEIANVGEEEEIVSINNML